eukprot:TRINITY_DN8744_c0_g1_i1.p1 TRINITY_DN8744_c0_g1~~TRINITY_DN8744_c0_g1_i1.p1  ORF type:complete len:818 (+),score=301.19 TRINITY_DN8744_c0_g1_i1:60-2513(+)
MSENENEEKTKQEKAFALVLDKAGLGSSSMSIQWCPVMDIIALISANTIWIYRFMDEWHRLFAFSASESASNSSVSPSNFTTATWRPDGKVIAAALASGHIVLYDIESGSQIYVETPKEECSVTCLHWIEIAKEKNSNSNSHSKFNSNESEIERFFGALEPLGSESLQTQASKETKGKSLNVLVSYDSLGKISFRAFGTYVIATLDLCLVDWKRNLGDFDVKRIFLSSDLHVLTVILTSKRESGCTLYSQADFDVSILWKSRFEIFELSTRFMEIQRLLDHVLLSFEEISRRWIDGTLFFQEKLKLFSAIPHAMDEGSLDDQLFELLTRGSIPGPALEQFLKNTMNDSHVRKMRKDLELATTDLISLFQIHLIKASEMIFRGLLSVQSLSKWDERYEKLKIEPMFSEAAIALVASLIARTQGQLFSIVEMSRDLDVFFKWILRQQVKLSEIEMEQGAVRVALSKIGQVDELKVLEFLEAHPLDSLSDVFNEGLDRQIISSGVPSNLMPYPSDSGIPLSGLLETMQDAINQLFSSPVQTIEQSMTLITQNPLFECDREESALFEFGQDSNSANWIGFAQIGDPSVHLCKLPDLATNQHGNFCRLTISPSSNLLDFAFYTEDRLAVLYQTLDEEKGEVVTFGLIKYNELPCIPLQMVELGDEEELVGILGPTEMDDPREPEKSRQVPSSSVRVDVSSKRGTGSVWVNPKRILLFDLEDQEEEEDEEGEAEEENQEGEVTRDELQNEELGQSRELEEGEEEEQENEEPKTPAKKVQVDNFANQNLNFGDPIDTSMRRSANNSVSDMSFSSAENISMEIDD